MGYAQGNVDMMSFALWISRGLRMRNARHSHLARRGWHGLRWVACPSIPMGGVGPARKGRSNGAPTHNFIFIFL
jgi:hypothetical protein